MIVCRYGLANLDKRACFDEEFDLKNVVGDLFNLAREKRRKFASFC